MSTGERAHVRASALCNRASSMRLNQSSREGARRGMFHSSIETLSTLLQRRMRKRKPQGFPGERSKRKRERPRERAEAKVLFSFSNFFSEKRPSAPPFEIQNGLQRWRRQEVRASLGPAPASEAARADNDDGDGIGSAKVL